MCPTLLQPTLPKYSPISYTMEEQTVIQVKRDCEAHNLQGLCKFIGGMNWALNGWSCLYNCASTKWALKMCHHFLVSIQSNIAQWLSLFKQVVVQAQDEQFWAVNRASSYIVRADEDVLRCR